MYHYILEKEKILKVLGCEGQDTSHPTLHRTMHLTLRPKVFDPISGDVQPWIKTDILKVKLS